MNSFGRLFRLTLFGESHGPGVGVVLDGCPAGLPLAEADFAADLDRRRPAEVGTTARREADRPAFLSGLFEGRTTGAPLTLFFANAEARPGDYDFVRTVPRPGHADLTARIKSGGYNDHRGAGPFSGRMTLPLVAAGVVAKILICPAAAEARLEEAGGEADAGPAAARAASEGDSIGGLIACRVAPVPVGLGEPFFDSLESLLAHLVFSIPGVKGIEFGAGFRAARMRGSEHNDPVTGPDGATSSNHAGGINGGISSGNPILFRVAVKPASSIARVQRTWDFGAGRPADLSIPGRHDACFALRLPPVVEAAAAIVLADLMLLEGRIPRVFDRPSGLT
jgi:chorismate synthase